MVSAETGRDRTRSVKRTSSIQAHHGRPLQSTSLPHVRIRLLGFCLAGQHHQMMGLVLCVSLLFFLLHFQSPLAMWTQTTHQTSETSVLLYYRFVETAVRLAKSVPGPGMYSPQDAGMFKVPGGRFNMSRPKTHWQIIEREGTCSTFFPPFRSSLSLSACQLILKASSAK